MAESLDDYDQNESSFEEIDFEEIEDKLNKEINTSTKPVYDKNTPAKIEGIKLLRGANPEMDRKDREYYPLTLQIRTVVTDNGKKVESIDNYNGLREYDDGFWNGQKSAFGRLMKLAQGEEEIKTYRDLLRFLPGKGVKIKTEDWKFGGQEGQKNIIQSFR
ncbi:MAG: hypothetical protein A4E27_01644 [Methanobacterium sp. PtaU1.Bin242]|jgi:hypothetical protein|nr:MAG: hypothetical protein A4E27_01644 [Methanobacterium sp. PtaU1.Bin242]